MMLLSFKSLMLFDKRKQPRRSNGSLSAYQNNMLDKEIHDNSSINFYLDVEYVCVGKVNNLCFKIFIKSSHRILRSSIMLAVTASSVISFQLHIVY